MALSRPMSWLPGLWLGIVVVLVFASGLLPLGDAYEQRLLQALQSPSSNHWMGTDSLGRDVLARTIEGLKVSLSVGLGSVAMGMAFGGLLGLLAGYYRGWLDAGISALMTIILSFPPLILAMTIIAYAEASLGRVIMALGVLFIPACARLVRAGVLRFVDHEFITAARAAGQRDRYIVFRELMPNLYPPVLAYALLLVAIAIVAEASLSFLGLSVPSPQPSLGGMISAERGNLGLAPWAVFGPAATLMATVLSLNIVGDQFQQATDRTRRLI